MSAAAALGTVPPDRLVDERLHLHAAAQMVAWAGRKLLPPADGPIRAALFWDGREGGRLTGAPISRPTSADSIRVAVAFDQAAIQLLEGDSRVVRDRLMLDRTTFATAWAWLSAALDRAGVDTGRLTPPPVDQLPANDIRAGRPFAIEGRASASLGRWYGLADGVLRDQAAAHRLDPAVPCWSHHFDMALVVPLGRPNGAQVTLGFSPGDDTIPEPYLYVLAWPLPEQLPPLPDAPAPGRWQRDGWTGLALPGSVLIGPRAADAGPAPVARSFLDRGFEIARALALAG